MLLASPAMAINLLMGQNGCLTAALWVGGAALLPRRPATAGALFGLLTFKPQLGVLIPVFLLAGRRYRAILAACLSAAVLAAASVVAFGPGSWRAFVDLTLPTQFSSMAAWQGLYQWYPRPSWPHGCWGRPRPWPSRPRRRSPSWAPSWSGGPAGARAIR